MNRAGTLARISDLLKNNPGRAAIVSCLENGAHDITLAVLFAALDITAHDNPEALENISPEYVLGYISGTENILRAFINRTPDAFKGILS